VLSVVLVVLAALVALVGGVAFYVRQELVDAPTFANRTVDALHSPAVQRVVAKEITVQLIEGSVPDLISARPVITSAMQLVVSSDPFQQVVRVAAEQGHRLLFERHGGNVGFDIADVGTIAVSVLQTLEPKLAQDIPRQAQTILLTLRKRSFATETLRFVDAIRVLGFVLPPVALLLFVIAVAVAPDRRTAITRSGIAIGVTGIVFAIVLAVARRYTASHVHGPSELTGADVRGAVTALWGAYLDDLMVWTLVIAAVGWLVAAASASVLAPYSSAAGVARVRAFARRPVSTRGRAARGVVALALGVFVFLEPTLAVRVVALLGGGLLVYFGAGEVLSAIPPAPPHFRQTHPPRRRRREIAAGLLTVTLATGVGLVVALTVGSANVRANAVATCNGYAQLCNRRLDQVVFAGTHNSMSAAATPGWLIPNQDYPIARQLNDGIRLFKISTHYGIQIGGHVRTDISAEGQRLNRVAKKLSPVARQALQRLSNELLQGSHSGGKRDIWLCHTLCELGATRMVSFLTVIRRFLELNPNQVVILFDEDYVTERDLQSAFKRAGLFRYLATLHHGTPLPTLAELIRTHHNVVVFAQNPTSGKYPWNANGFTWIQDTPLGATKPSQFNCRLKRGHANNPLLMMNDWADTFPPQLSPNLPLVKRDFILARARQCVAQRGRIPNLILTDYYDRGDVVGAVATLNRVANEQPAPTVPVPTG
jgi:hypothetical protein